MKGRRKVNAKRETKGLKIIMWTIRAHESVHTRMETSIYSNNCNKSLPLILPMIFPDS